MLAIKKHTKSYLSRICHCDRRIDHQHVTNILQSGSVSLQVLKSESSSQKRLNVFGLSVNSVSHAYIVLQNPGRVLHHGHVVTELLVAGSTVVVAGDQHVAHGRVFANALDSVCLLRIRDRMKAKKNRLNGLSETRGLEVLITLRLVTIQRRHSTDLLLAHLLSLGLRNTKQHQKILVVREYFQTTAQKLLGLNELVLRSNQPLCTTKLIMAVAALW